MKKIILNITLLIAFVVTLLSFDSATGWFSAGSKPKSYEMGIEKGAGQEGKNAATIKSIDVKIDGFGTYMQQSKPDKYLGKRIRMSGFVKSQNVTSWAGLWFRVDQQGSKESLSFDNMGDRPIVGTTGWKQYDIVLDVPANASLIAYGALLDGTGQIWFDNITIEIVPEYVPTTGSKTGKKSATVDEPTNLDFEK